MKKIILLYLSLLVLLTGCITYDYNHRVPPREPMYRYHYYDHDRKPRRHVHPDPIHKPAPRDSRNHSKNNSMKY